MRVEKDTAYWTQQVRLPGVWSTHLLQEKLAFWGSARISAIGGSDFRTDLGSKKAWVNKCIPPRIQKF